MRRTAPPSVASVGGSDTLWPKEPALDLGMGSTDRCWPLLLLKALDRLHPEEELLK